MITIRTETPADQNAVRRLNERAFEQPAEAGVVDALRTACPDYTGFVAENHGLVIGHILFTPAVLTHCARVGMGLAPMAVLPEHQRQGIGSKLVRYGLAALERTGYPFVIVLGHPEFYPRFGFEPASRYQLSSQWDNVPDEAFMIRVFDPAALPGAPDIACYREEFNAAM